MYPSEGRQNENHNPRKLTKWSHGTQPCVTQWNYKPCCAGSCAGCCAGSRQTDHGGEFWQNVVHWRREWQTTSVFLPWMLNRMKQYEKGEGTMINCKHLRMQATEDSASCLRMKEWYTKNKNFLFRFLIQSSNSRAYCSHCSKNLPFTEDKLSWISASQIHVVVKEMCPSS